MKLYDVYWGQNVVGTATVEAHGLYYRIHCICRFSKSGIYRIYISTSSGTCSLGVCIPKGDAYMIDTQIPTNRLPECEFAFHACTKDDPGDVVYPIKTNVPCDHLENLRNCYLVHSAGGPHLKFGSRSPDQ